MEKERKKITISVRHAGDEYVLQPYLHEYRSLMALLNNHLFLENFGACGGQGRCATCLVHVSGLTGKAIALERNEQATLQKAGLPGSNTRLSCQLLLNEDLNEAVIGILGEGD